MRVALVLLLSVLLGACGSGGSEELPVTVLYAAVHCDDESVEPGVRYTRDPERLPSRLAGEARNADAVILIEMGMKPTGGYALDLATQAMTVADGVARLRVRWQEPAPDAMVTQALTSPCLLVGVPAADYRAVEIVDQNGALRIRSVLD